MYRGGGGDSPAHEASDLIRNFQALPPLPVRAQGAFVVWAGPQVVVIGSRSDLWAQETRLYLVAFDF